MKTNLLLLGFLLAAGANADTVALSAEQYSVNFTYQLLGGGSGSIARMNEPKPIDQFLNAADLALGESAAGVREAYVSLGGTLPFVSAFVANAKVSYVVYIQPDASAPLNITSVPVLTKAAGSVVCKGSSGGASDAYAEVTIGTIIAPLFNQNVTCNTAEIPDAEFKVNTSLLFKIRTSVPVLLAAGGSGGTVISPDSPTGSFDFTATADPTFQIDPSFPFASDYQILVSPDGTQAGVPEPATYGTLASALAGLLLGRRLIRPRSRARRKN